MREETAASIMNPQTVMENHGGAAFDAIRSGDIHVVLAHCCESRLEHLLWMSVYGVSNTESYTHRYKEKTLYRYNEKTEKREPYTVREYYKVRTDFFECRADLIGEIYEIVESRWDKLKDQEREYYEQRHGDQQEAIYYFSKSILDYLIRTKRQDTVYWHYFEGIKRDRYRRKYSYFINPIITQLEDLNKQVNLKIQKVTK